MEEEKINRLFYKATNDVKNLTSTPDNDTLLSLYALFKQATVGDNLSTAPSFFDFRGTAKYNAWLNLKGMKKDQAQIKYIKLVRKLTENS